MYVYPVFPPELLVSRMSHNNNNSNNNNINKHKNDDSRNNNYHHPSSRGRPAPGAPGLVDVLEAQVRSVFHNFNLRIFNLRVSNPNKFIVDVFV